MREKYCDLTGLMGYLSLQLLEKQKDSIGQGCSCFYIWHCIRHLPEIWYDVYDITSRATAVGRKPPAIALPARNGHTAAFGGP